ncbi:MAG: putative signaling protein [Solirubrobacterales bacterium]|nr:putative signaling protein [Solirubrobacterales bacterium]
MPSVDQDGHAIAKGAEALLREHPTAQVCALAGNGLIVPVPQSVGLWGQGLIEGRALIDNVVAADRTAVVRLWISAGKEGAAATKVRMLASPEKWSTLHFLDMREIHGIFLGVILPSDEDADHAPTEPESRPAAPRFCTLTEDEGARVLAADEAFTEMFGYTEQELIGKSVLDQIHPDDQGRAVEGWLAVISSNRAQQTRLRRRRKDGSYMWVDTTLHNFLNEPGRNCVVVEIIDISAEMAAQEALHEHEQLLRRMTDAMPVGLLQIDTERDVVYNNACLLDILYGSEPLDSAAPTDVQAVHGEAPAPGAQSEPSAPAVTTLLQTLTPESMQTFDTVLGEVLDEGVDRDVEVDIELPSGAWRRALMSLRVLTRASGEASGAITCVLDITDSARARQELEQRATYDTLTHAYNRSAILAVLQEELDRTDGACTGVVYVDLDDFKPVNDTLGHAAGDELLVRVTERLKLASRESDVLGRLGGDEFLMVLRELPTPELAMQVADRISMTVCGHFDLSGGAADLRVSIGVACGQSGGVTAEELVKRADAAMYRSKSDGRSAPVLAPA